MPDSGANKTTGRSLPSWMSSRENAKKSDGEEPSDVGADKEDSEGGARGQAKRHGKAHTSQTHFQENERKHKSSASNLGANKFSKLLEGVVFVLSGFVNPERSELRSQALEMGAEYQADWNTNCTLLVCAFPNTPKFRQVEADSGTIVSKEWIIECYKQKRLVEIETYLMHAGKPWRRQTISTGASQAQTVVADLELSSSKKSEKLVDKAAHSKPTTSVSSKMAQSHAKDGFSTSMVKKWAIDDMKRTISWLDSQEEKPDPSEIKKIAAEGILTCLQDAIDSLRQEQDIGKIIEQWSFVPLVVEELRKLETSGDASSCSKKDIYRQAMACKQIYEVELGNLDDDSTEKKKRAKIEESARVDSRREKPPTNNDADYDSDETIEMTEDEIGEAYNTVASSIVYEK